MRRVLVIVIAVCAGSMLVPGVASANQPIRTPFGGPYTGEAACDGFTDVFTGTSAGSWEMVYTDHAGNPVRLVDHWRDVEVDTNSVSGKTITVRYFYRAELNFLTGVATFTGEQVMATFPGQGAVIHDAGKVTIDELGDITQAGRHDVWEFGQDAFCAALS
jgi:hypothetical protein